MFNFGYPFNPEREPLLYPGVPTDLTVVYQDDLSVLVSWNAPIGGDVPAVYYELAYGTNSINKSETTASLRVTPNVPYDYKVRSVSAEGARSDWTDVVTYTNVVPQTGVDTTTGQVDIAFTDATNTVYWDGSQYVQEAVVDTPIAPAYENLLNDTAPTMNNPNGATISPAFTSDSTNAHAFGVSVQGTGHVDVSSGLTRTTVTGEVIRFVLDVTINSGDPYVYRIVIGDTPYGTSTALVNGINELEYTTTTNGWANATIRYYANQVEPARLFDITVNSWKVEVIV